MQRIQNRNKRLSAVPFGSTAAVALAFGLSVVVGCSGGNVGSGGDGDPAAVGGGDNNSTDDVDNTDDSSGAAETADAGAAGQIPGSDPTSGGDTPSGGVTPSSAAGDDGCLSNREFLATQAWNGVIASSCLSCHGPGGVAADQNAEFTIKPAAYPGFLEANLAVIERVAKTSYDGVSVLLRKPLGDLQHGGGAVLKEDSEPYKLLEDLVARVSQGESCDESASVATFDDVQLLSPRETWRKATLNLAGRLPLTTEYEVVDAEGESALPTLLAGLMTEDAFYDRLVEMFNDQWLTDRYLRDANNVLNRDDFPAITTYYDEMSDEQRNAARRSLAREPLQLMAYIVRNDRPFTEIVTADYTVLNSYSAIIYNNSEVGFTGNEYNDTEYRPGQIYASREQGLLPFPHAGILTSPIFLNRYPTSRTNLNRHRAGVVLRELLATDILKVADRPIDPTKAVNFANPTREEASCKMCHVTIDPIAGAFQKFDDSDYERYREDRVWPTEMFLPGFGDEQMQVSDYDNALQWLGTRIAKDERFPLAVVRNMYKRIVGESLMDFPENPADGSYFGWAAQDETIRAISESFVAQNYNLKTVIQGLVLSPYFRAVQTTATDPARLAQLGPLGTARLLTPERLQRKIFATLGYQWLDGQNPALTGSLNILYGGIDSDSVTERLDTPNGIMSAVMWRMANEVSCAVVPMDFAKAQSDRRLFRDVDVTTFPEDEFGDEDPDGRAAITKNLRSLYARLLGKAPAEDSAEFARAYDLFLKTWKAGRNELAFEDGNRRLPYGCQYRRAPGASEDLPEEERLTDDETYIVRSWMAVMTYLLSDYTFLYD